MRTRAAVIGHPVAHSRSPAMHTAAYRALGLDWELHGDRRAAGRARRRSSPASPRADFAGVNVTIPHKQAVLGLCDELSDEARRAGSVNTVLVRDGRLRGETTDGAGLLWALGPTSSRPMRSCSARAAPPARRWPRSRRAGWRVAVSARRPEAAAELGVAVPALAARARRAALVVNATPIGQQEAGRPRQPGTGPIARRAASAPGMVVCDLAYRGDGAPTPLIEAAGRARRAGRGRPRGAGRPGHLRLRASDRRPRAGRGHACGRSGRNGAGSVNGARPSTSSAASRAEPAPVRMPSLPWPGAHDRALVEAADVGQAVGRERPQARPGARSPRARAGRG